MSLARDAKLEIVGHAVKHAVTGGLTGAAASIVSGAAIGSATTTTPVTILWGLLTIGSTVTTTPIWLPGVIAGCAVGGAVVAGTAGAAAAYHRIQELDAEWSTMSGMGRDD